MCQLATANFPWAEVNDHDLTAPIPSYSWRTAEHFTEQYPDAELYWLMGADQWETIQKWDRAEHLASLVKFIVISRGEDPAEIPGFERTSLTGAHTASATAIRQDASATNSISYLHPEVLHYVKEHQLY